MSETLLDPRPFHERPKHWHYGRCCWQREFIWDERVAMSELFLGPDDVSLNAEKRITSVNLQYRKIRDEKLAYLTAFEFLSTLILNHSTVTDACLEHVKTLPHLRWLWIADTQITDAAKRRFQKAKPHVIVLASGEGAIWNPLFKKWVKISNGSQFRPKPWWKFW